MTLFFPIVELVMLGYNMLSPLSGQRILPLAKKHDVGTMIMCAVRSVFSQPKRVAAQLAEWKRDGLLADDAPDDLAWVSDDLTSAAYKFAAQPQGVSTVLCGTGNVEHLEANVRAILSEPLPPGVPERLKALFVPVGRNVGHGMRG